MTIRSQVIHAVFLVFQNSILFNFTQGTMLNYGMRWHPSWIYNHHKQQTICRDLYKEHFC